MYKRLEQRCSVNVKPIAACRQILYQNLFARHLPEIFPFVKIKGPISSCPFPVNWLPFWKVMMTLMGHLLQFLKLFLVQIPFRRWSNPASFLSNNYRKVNRAIQDVLITECQTIRFSRGPSIMAATNLVPLMTLLFLLDVYELIHRNRSLNFSQDSR